MIEHFLELGGKVAGRIRNVNRGGVRVLIPPPGGRAPVVTFEDVTFECGAGMSSAFYEWLGSGVDRRPVRKDVSVFGLDDFGVEKLRLELQNALISGVALPPLAAASRDDASLTVKVRAEATKSSPSGVKPKTPPIAVGKRWSVADYRLSISGVDTSRVFSIEGMSVGIKMAELSAGSKRDYQIEPVSTQYPNLVVTVSEKDGEGFFSWHKEMLTKGGISEKFASLEYLAPGGKATYFRVELREVGVVQIAGPMGSGIRSVKVEMYCEDMSFKAQPAACVG
jgi:hypothetical protein